MENTSLLGRIKSRRRVTTSSLNDACDLSQLLTESGEDVTIFMTPPDNTGDTDEDSEDDDDPDYQPAIANFSRNMLEADIEIVLPTPVAVLPDSDDTEANCSAPKVKKSKKIHWKEGDWASQQKLPNFDSYEPPANGYIDFERLWTPTECAELFWFSDEVLTKIQSFSIKYAQKKNNFSFSVCVDELKVFFSIVLLSRYVKCRSRRMYWEPSSDTHNEAISNAMTRNRFDEIIKYIYMYDPDSAEADDKCAKSRPIMDIINGRFLKYCPSEKIGDVDEAMIPYYRTYGCGIKQAMRQKPIRFGYKVWCLNYPDGYLIAFDVYQGAKGRPNPHKEKFGVGGESVLALVDRLPEDHKLQLFLDNYFTSPALYDELSRRGFLVTGTFRKDRIGHFPLPRLNKSPRGTMSYHTKEAGGMVLVKWHDNGEIIVGSNCIGADPVGKVKRWSVVEKRKWMLMHLPQFYCIILTWVEQLCKTMHFLVTVHPFAPRSGGSHWPVVW